MYFPQIRTHLIVQVDNLAIFLVCLMYPAPPAGGDTSKHPNLNALKHLSVLINALENYYHPSNHGSWTSTLVQFLHSVSAEFLKRCLYEKQENCVIPNHLRLTQEMRDEFVRLVSRPAFLAMFGRDSSSVTSAHFSLRNIAWIAPEAVFPTILDYAYVALEGFQAHRTLSCIGALSILAQPLVHRKHYPEGARHVLPLCMFSYSLIAALWLGMLVLPGIDINDPAKTLASLRFLERIGMLVPLTSEFAEVIVGFLDRLFKMVCPSFLNT